MDTDRNNALAALQAYLAHMASGEITNATEVERLLAVAWDDLLRDDGGMESYKLFNRMEDVTWTPPLLTFRIERHGATVMGSSRAEMQAWTIDVEKGTACCEAKGYRQLSPRQRPLDVKPLAAEVAGLILEHVEDASL